MTYYSSCTGTFWKKAVRDTPPCLVITILIYILAHLLEKDCAICKEQFTLHPEDDGELIIVTLPCDHPFHEDCILPWLKSSGTCPVCRSV